MPASLLMHCCIICTNISKKMSSKSKHLKLSMLMSGNYPGDSSIPSSKPLKKYESRRRGRYRIYESGVEIRSEAGRRIGAESETPKALRGGKWRGGSPSQPTMGSGERRRLFQRGSWPKMSFGALERSHMVTKWYFYDTQKPP